MILIENITNQNGTLINMMRSSVVSRGLHIRVKDCTTCQPSVYVFNYYISNQSCLNSLLLNYFNLVLIAFFTSLSQWGLIELIATLIRQLKLIIIGMKKQRAVETKNSSPSFLVPRPGQLKEMKRAMGLTGRVMLARALGMQLMIEFQKSYWYSDLKAPIMIASVDYLINVAIKTSCTYYHLLLHILLLNMLCAYYHPRDFWLASSIPEVWIESNRWMPANYLATNVKNFEWSKLQNTHKC